ncbi:SGNH/GDSL hydrolase family protein [Herbaspirillum lusitanum]|uniref:SGNH/GDSL hydrolase family protein n=1 Tax=Herbaspirillum lusitanum TaxID=213312 RepID=UPI0022383889|nr:SGNH/GDSL hydrolase family protein [Herbaspirillum lusitanum]MCW5299558.1 SGNH/GDSL hydrolase family protein [Herbaspirillum lusitanum]
MRRWLPELLALPLLPWLYAQGKRTRRITPRLPEADGAREGLCTPAEVGDAVPVVLIAVGESPVAGVGVERQEEAITAQFAQELAVALRRPVQWRAFGKNGATVADAHRDVLPQLAQSSLPKMPRMQELRIVLIAFGVNDSTAFHGSGRYRRDLAALAHALQRQLSPSLLLISGAPPLHLFPALPQPLRHVLGMKAAVLSRAAQQLAAELPRAIYVPVRSDARERNLMAHDGYHPSAAGARIWAQQLAQATVEGLRTLGALK